MNEVLLSLSKNLASGEAFLTNWRFFYKNRRSKVHFAPTRCPVLPKKMQPLLALEKSDGHCGCRLYLFWRSSNAKRPPSRISQICV